MDGFERRVLDALPLTVCTIDLDGRITSANRSWSRIARGSAAPERAEDQSLVGSSLWNVLGDPGAREQVERAMDLLRSGRSQAVAWEFLDGSPTEERVLLLQIAPLHDGHTVGGYVFSTVDITPSHRARSALIDAGIALSGPLVPDRLFHEAAQQVRRAIPHDAIAIAIADESSAALTVAHTVGYDERSTASEGRLRHAWRETMEQGTVIIHRADGAIELTAPLATADRMLGAMTVRTDDIDSPPRLAEAQRTLATLAAQTAAVIERASAAQRAEHRRQLQAVGEVAAGVARELRNPLFGIASAAQLLRFRAREDPVVETNVGRILREADRLNRIATELLEFGRPRSVSPTPVDPDAIWDEVLESHRGQLESRSLQLQRTRAEPAVRCSVDIDQMTRVFANVLLNAIDAAPEASDLALRSERLSGGAWRCRLTNGGDPMAPDTVRRAFELFFSTKPGGTGIGLALSQRIIEEHDGTISMESGAGTGTTVTVVLPATP